MILFSFVSGIANCYAQIGKFDKDSLMNRFVYQLGDTQASQGIGYKEFFPYFNGQNSLEEVAEQIKQNSRRYAKRQLTWFRNRLTAQWFDLVEQPEKQQVIETKIQKWLEESQ